MVRISVEGFAVNSIVVVCDLVALLAIALAMAAVCTYRGRTLPPIIRALLGGLLAVKLFHSFSNVMEYSGLSTVFDPVGDYVEILEPVFWVFVLYAFLQEAAKRSMEESELRFRQLAENIREVFWLANADGSEMIYISPAYEQIWGRSCESLYAQPRSFMDVVHPGDRQRVLAGLEQRRKGELVQIEYRIVQSDRTIKWISSRVFPIVDKTGRVCRVAGIAEDITDRKGVEETLSRNENLLRTIINATRDAMIAIGDDGLISLFNPAAEQMFGRTREEMIGQSLDVLMPAEYRDRHREYVRSYFATGKPDGAMGRTLELPGVRRDGTVFAMEISLSAGMVYEQKFVVAVARDITERKKVEGELLENRARLKSLASELSVAEERERRRLGGVLHDKVSQLLVIAKMKLEAIRQRIADGCVETGLDEVTDSLDQAIDDARTLTFDMSYPILYELGFEAAVAEWLADEVEGKHGIATEFEDDGQSKPMDSDVRAVLFRDVRELLFNVVRHSKANKVKVSVARAGEQIRVAVEDNGVGFDPDEVASAFSGSKAFGLFSIRERLGHIGGSLQIKSAAGCGCKVTLTAPLKKES